MKNLDPALDWARRHRQQLEVRGSDLEFRLHQLRFVTILTGSDGSKDPASLDYSERVLRALNYAKQEFSVFGSAYLKGNVCLSL